MSSPFEFLDPDEFEVAAALFLKWHKEPRIEKVINADLPESEKIARLRRIIFASADDMEKSGSELCE